MGTGNIATYLTLLQRNYHLYNMHIDFSNLSPNQIYHTIIQSVIPRPIAWVLTENDTGDYNLAPFSYFTPVSSNPPLLMFSVGKKGVNTKKDTLTNIEKRTDFVIHIAQADLAEELNQSSATLEYGESELTNSSLTTIPMDGFSIPRIKQTKIAFACSLHEIKEVGNTPMSLVFAEIKSAYICDSIISNEGKHNTIHANELNPLSRLGGNDYATLSEPFTLGRPK